MGSTPAIRSRGPPAEVDGSRRLKSWIFEGEAAAAGRRRTEVDPVVGTARGRAARTVSTSCTRVARASFQACALGTKSGMASVSAVITP